MLDPACPDITGRVIEALCACGEDPRSDAVRRGVEYLVRTQEHDGSWYGRWGVNYIYGTFLALRGLRAAGEGGREAHLLRAGEWLRSIQNADGGWGESCAGYDTNSVSVQKGIEYLLETQRDDGAWDEEQATGTGCPGILYLTYQLYRNAFPLLALSTFVKARGHSRGDFE
jgi:squalene-hopene/tetraprenyl-beta-curcumene cyclase